MNSLSPETADAIKAVSEHGLIVPYVDRPVAHPEGVGVHLLRLPRGNVIVAFSSTAAQSEVLGSAAPGFRLFLSEARAALEPGECWLVDPGLISATVLDANLLDFLHDLPIGSQPHMDPKAKPGSRSGSAANTGGARG